MIIILKYYLFLQYLKNIYLFFYSNFILHFIFSHLILFISFIELYFSLTFLIDSRTIFLLNLKNWENNYLIQNQFHCCGFQMITQLNNNCTISNISCLKSITQKLKNIIKSSGKTYLSHSLIHFLLTIFINNSLNKENDISYIIFL